MVRISVIMITASCQNISGQGRSGQNTSLRVVMVESWFLDLDQNRSGAAESGKGR